ncbi:unnamed protein product [Effrenium voratum]|uniref:Uncharacterized protein n=1 Tax=Effrenium voratum TaxID=2562239 RepID=A0AA36J600_9DINO|nr:unnamed protein product [Effrenium voratum]CAJ1419791.1 unnamed protein product [Effrenium voratum]
MAGTRSKHSINWWHGVFVCFNARPVCRTPAAKRWVQLAANSATPLFGRLPGPFLVALYKSLEETAQPTRMALYVAAIEPGTFADGPTAVAKVEMAGCLCAASQLPKANLLAFWFPQLAFWSILVKMSKVNLLFGQLRH